MRILFFILIFLVSSCSQPDEKAWIILELSLPGGVPKKMAFHSPSAQDATLEECKEALPNVLPELIGYIKSEARFEGAKVVKAQCVMAMGDPLKVDKL
jgi:hypothetical protein